jgi:Outer membrane protein beta-barrel domain
MKKILLPLYILSFSLLAHAQKDSSVNNSSDTLKKIAADTIRIGNMIIVNDKSKTGTYEMGHGIVKIDFNSNDHGYRHAKRAEIRARRNNRNASVYIKSNKDTLFSVNDDTVRVGRINIIKSQNGDVKKDWESILEDGDFDNTHIKIERAPKKLSNVSTNWWIFDLGFANYRDETKQFMYLMGYPATNTDLPYNKNWVNANDLKLNNVKSSNVNIWIVQQKVNLYQHYLNLKYGVGIEMYNFRFEQPISFRKDPNDAIFIDNVKFSKDKLFVEYLSVPIQLNFQSNPSNNKSFYASIGMSTGYLVQSHTKQISEERGKKKVNGNFNLNNLKMSTIGELGIGSIRLYGSYNMTNLFDKNLTSFDFLPYAIGVRFSKF